MFVGHVCMYVHMQCNAMPPKTGRLGGTQIRSSQPPSKISSILSTIKKKDVPSEIKKFTPHSSRRNRTR